MEGEELPSESTSHPNFRRKVNKTTTSTNICNANSSFSVLLNKNVESTSKRTKRKRRKTKNKFSSREKKFSQRQKPKGQQRSLIIIVAPMLMPTMILNQHQFTCKQI